MPTPHYGQPRYRMIADELRALIDRGVIAPGSLLPAESVLTAEFRASRGTVRQAIAVLREEGVVTTEHGRGTYANAYPDDRHSRWRSERHVKERQVAADAELAALFGVDAGARLIETESVTWKGGKAHTVTRTYRLHPNQSVP